MSRRIRKVVVHKTKRGVRKSRYQLINWAFREGKKLSKLDSVDRDKLVDRHLGEFLDNYSGMRVAEVIRIWVSRFHLVSDPLRLTNFERLHQRCGRIFVRREDAEDKILKQPFFLYAKNRVEFLTRVVMPYRDIPKLIEEFLKIQTGYSPMSEAEYVELQERIKEHLRELKYNPNIETFDVDTWRAVRRDKMLNRLYCLDEPK